MRRDTEITSPRNPRYKQWLRAAQGEVRKTGRTLVSGRRIVSELAAGPLPESAAWLVPARFDGELPGSQSVRSFTLSQALFGPLDQFNTGYPLLDLPVEDRVGPLPEAAPTGLSVALPLQDPNNVGALVRTAAGIGASAAFILPGCAHPFHPRSVRASSGAVFNLPLMHAPSLDSLAALGLSLVALDRAGTPVTEFEFPDSAVLVVGQEGGGINAALGSSSTSCANDVNIDLVSLPIERIDSYNASVAAAMALYEWKRRQSGE